MMMWELRLDDRFFVYEPDDKTNHSFVIKLIVSKEGAVDICNEINLLLDEIEERGTSKEVWMGLIKKEVYSTFLSKMLPNGYDSFLNLYTYINRKSKIKKIRKNIK
jgi:hypothetical protein